MTDRVIHTSSNEGANTVLIVVVLIVIAIIGFFVYTGSFDTNNRSTNPVRDTVDVNVDVPDGMDASSSTTTTRTTQ